jgi:PAS domain S-box-containing protein
MAGERILIVEDESIVAKDIRHSLQNLGYAVAAILASGEDAVAQVRELKPDLVLMDVRLKGRLDGIMAAEQIRALVSVPVVYLTAYIDDHTLKRAKSSQAYGYLLKPFEERDLRTTIEMALYRHTMEQKLQESQEWFATTLRCLGDAVIATDAAAVIQLINPIAEDLTGWPRSEAFGRPLSDVFCLKDQTLAWQQNQSAQAAEPALPASGKDSILVARDGNSVAIDYTAAPIRSGAGGASLGIVIIFRDVSSRLQAQNRERELQERLARSKRIEALGSLAGGVANDLNNILVPIADYHDLILKNLPADSPLRADLGIINNSSHKAIEIVHDLLTLGRIGHVPAEPLQLSAIVEDCRQSPPFGALQAKAPLVKLDIRLAPNLPLIMVSRQHLRAVVMNLLINAFDSMPDGGHLTLTATQEELNQPHEGYEVIEPGKYVVLRVTDTGAGIREEDLNQIFEPFFTKRNLNWGGGSGLGLAVVYGVVKDHKGFLDVASTLGKGSDFAVYFPVAGAPVESIHKLEPEGYQGTETILIVDDDAEQRKTVARWLRSHGYKVLTAPNGKTAFEIFQNETGSLEAPIDLVLLDMILGDEWDGLDTYRNILAFNARQKAVIISGFSITSRIQEAMRLGAGQYLQKPCTMEEMGKAVRLELDKL